MSDTVIKCIKDKDIKFKNSVYFLAHLIIILKAFFAYSELVSPVIAQKALLIGNILFLIILLYKIIILQKYTIWQVIIALFILTA